MMEFTKGGYMKYISHLDIMRLFKNAFKIAGIKPVYSQGFNPHPKMSFAQPLTLGYSSSCELVEFETDSAMTPSEMSGKMNAVLPDGINVTDCKIYGGGKSLAAMVFAAAYEITIPVGSGYDRDINELCHCFLSQENIYAVKRHKKTGMEKETDIKGKIKELELSMVDGKIIMNTKLDAGSNSNVSPELLITSFVEFAGLTTKRDEINVERIKLFF